MWIVGQYEIILSDICTHVMCCSSYISSSNFGIDIGINNVLIAWAFHFVNLGISIESDDVKFWNLFLQMEFLIVNRRI